MGAMRQLLTLAVCLVIVAAGAAASQSNAVVDNPRVRVFRTADGSPAGADHRPGVVVPFADGPGWKAGDASWADDVSRASDSRIAQGGRAVKLVIVEPGDAPPAAAPPSASQPGGAAFTGMSFKTLFENDKVRVIRARMEVGAREGFHTHASDTIVVHLSGGEIEDTADGKTVVNRWKPGDVEFEARGSSHSARNIGKAIDVVLVALK